MRFRNKVALIISAEGALGRLIMLMCISFLIVGCEDNSPRLSHRGAPQGANFSCFDPRLVTGFAEVHFREGSTEMLITDDRFREKFQWLLKSPERDRGFIVIEGHVDHHEADTMDGKTLSLRRAEAVADKFSALGLDRRYLVPVGRGDSIPYQIDDPPGSRVQPGNRRASFNPTRFNRTCDEYLLLQDAFFYLQNCRGMQSGLIGRASTRDLCEMAIRNVPEGLREIVRSGRIGTPQ